MNLAVGWIVGDDLLVQFVGSIKLPSKRVGVGLCKADGGRERIQFVGAVAFLDGFRHPGADGFEVLPVPLMGRAVAGVKLPGCSDLRLGRRKIPLVLRSYGLMG